MQLGNRHFSASTPEISDFCYMITGGSGIVRIGSISSLQFFICVYDYLIIDVYVRVCMCVCVYVCVIKCVCVCVCV